MKPKFLILTMTLLFTHLLSAGDFEKDIFLTDSGKEVTITFIKHGSLMITYEKQHIHVDPVTLFADYSTLPKADFILVTHEHGDHLDAKAIEVLAKENTRLVLNPSSRKILGKGEGIRNGERLRLSDAISLDAVPAYNTTPGREQFHPRHRDNGYILSLDGLRIYIAGDTEDIPEMGELKEIDVAFLPVNQPYTMTVEQAVHAAKMFTPGVLYPYHYGDTDVKPVVEQLKESGIDVRIRKME
ncbi:MBL fold metallo-hydrolase [Proteiniphilum sp. UBA1028]|uniref:MBL fold metallo-hydrolase n=1 Tax=Proteiniphilum sp. UBA1028 TaxID=1947251 RepID=UPI000E94EF6E|nr:MBL fold metallo-hydrolase [Proteiniphilum sp. UBA1028]HBG58749.1 metal-dependent hydrolase [Porphyromonadaceae bacterium]